MKRKAKMPMAPAPKAASAARQARGASRAPASQPMAPPALAAKMRGNAKMPKMMRKGGKVSRCK